MKSFIKFLALLIVWSSSAWITPQVARAQQGSVSFQLFYDDLSPYGMWVDYPDYGYVWIPDVDRGFSPYGTDGHWVFTDDGWTWVSNYSWGWAPFHYGRWAYDDYYGWLWVPHNEWGPAWVTWRRSEGYYGWAPMQPGMSIEVAFGERHRVPNERWIFVRDRDINRPDIDRHYVDRSTNVTIINRSTVINNTYTDNNRHTKYVAGPAKDDVQKVTGTAIKPVAIRDNDKPGQTLSNDQLQIYRPRVQTSNNNDRKPVPTKLVSLKEVKPVSERKPGNQQRDENLPNANPTGIKATGGQPPVVNPPDKNKGNEQPPQRRDVSPPDNKGRQQQPPGVRPADKSQPSQPRGANPSDKRRQEQPPAVKPPNKGQPAEPRDVNPSSKEKRQQPPAVKPPENGQVVQPRGANPSDKGRQQQSPVVKPSNNGQPVPPRNVTPPNAKGREQKPRTANPPNKDRPPQQQNVTPSNNTGKEKRPQSVTSPGKKVKAQPKTNQDETDKKKQGNEKKPDR